MKNIEQQSLSTIALEHHEVIPVFERYGLDFCCRGKKTLAEACEEKNISLAQVKEDLQNAPRSSKPALPFVEMTAEQLINYIIIHHHFYVRNSIPVIMNHLEKLIAKHGDRYVYLQKIDQLFTAVKNELEPHMQQEESLLFPAIKQIVSPSLQHSGTYHLPAAIYASLNNMEAEHDRAGQLLFEIRDLTNQYTAPDDACTTNRVCLEELKAFEADLHQHVHLENNILFPMAIAAMKKNELHNSDSQKSDEDSCCRL